jgi:hypothetical protein
VGAAAEAVKLMLAALAPLMATAWLEGENV